MTDNGTKTGGVPLDMGVVGKTHGVRGEVKIRPSCDSPAFLARFNTLIIGGVIMHVETARAVKDALLVKLKGIDTVEAAMALIGKAVEVDYEAAEKLLPPGRYFVRDLMNCEIRDCESGITIGRLTEVLHLPAHDVYVVSGGAAGYMIPVVDEFVKEINVKEKFISVKIIEGMEV